jgi:hypothetical protein
MQRWFPRALAAFLCVVMCAAGASGSLWSRAGFSLTEDRNGDRRPDVWRVYDRQGQLSEVAFDTNFDGRADVYEYYEGGVLVRRQSDRDFNDQVDLIEEFDPATRGRVRAVEDVDYDGKADLLVLFQGGRPVYLEWAPRAAPTAASAAPAGRSAIAPHTANDPLTPLDDLFRTDLALRAVYGGAVPLDWVALLPSGVLPVSGRKLGRCPASSSAIEPTGCRQPFSATLDPHSPRGPPVSYS